MSALYRVWPLKDNDLSSRLRDFGDLSFWEFSPSRLAPGLLRRLLDERFEASRETCSFDVDEYVVFESPFLKIGVLLEEPCDDDLIIEDDIPRLERASEQIDDVLESTDFALFALDSRDFETGSTGLETFEF